ncbi:acylglycerol lipase [Marinobacter santoriniensis NKSG1]|uniref:Acylglycerol lipase n=1 Tax=Marinobacter santoriniensis NKSG1 TaxID=1288826 RepID=M7D2X7_9GAMM|nr:alpha/beta hydrolase [Marinobacter santoriniensis]EMP55108.1 acylglycerol lipase [Marinobacter santoriniensis NKSG1]
MNEDTLSIEADDGRSIKGTLVAPANPEAVLVIAHGMAEHAGRYLELARWMAQHGIAVVACNHRGHGPECPADQRGHYSDAQGWHKVTDDLHRVILHSRQAFPGLPVNLLGHSMGSFIAQSVAQQYGSDIDTLILSATNRINRGELLPSRFLVSLIRAFRGRHHRSRLIAGLTFGKFNRQFQPNRTDYDWLSRDTEQVDQYIADPSCGFECSVGLWHDFISGMLSIDPKTWRRDLPVHLFAGSRDPVGEMGAGIRTHFQAIREAGIQTVTLRLFEEGRHEMLNEVNAAEVTNYLYSLCRRQASNTSATDDNPIPTTA